MPHTASHPQNTQPGRAGYMAMELVLSNYEIARKNDKKAENGPSDGVVCLLVYFRVNTEPNVWKNNN